MSVSENVSEAGQPSLPNTDFDFDHLVSYQANNNISTGLNRYLSEPVRESAPQYLYAVWSLSIRSTSAVVENEPVQDPYPLADLDDFHWSVPPLLYSENIDNDGTQSTVSSQLSPHPFVVRDHSSDPEYSPNFLRWLETVPVIRQYSDDQFLQEDIRALGAGLELSLADDSPSVQIISDERPRIPNLALVDIPNTNGAPQMLDQAVQIADDTPESSHLPTIHAPNAAILAQDSQIADNSSGVPLPLGLNILGAPILAQDTQRDINVPDTPRPLPDQQPFSNDSSRVVKHHIHIADDEVHETAQLEYASNTLDIPENSSGRKRKRRISGSRKRRKAERSSQGQAFPAADIASGTARTSSRNEQDTEPDKHAGRQIQSSMKLNGGSVPLESVAFRALRRAVKNSINTQKTLPYRTPFGNQKAKRKIRKAFDKIPKIVNLPVLVFQDASGVPPPTEEGGKFVAQRPFSTTNSGDDKQEAALWHNPVILAILDAPFSSKTINQCAVYDKLSPEKKKTHRCREEKPGNLIHQLGHLLERHYDLECPCCIENFQILRNPQDAYSRFKSIFYDTISELRAHIRGAHILPWYCTTCNKRFGINTKSKGKQHSCTNLGFVLRLVPELEDLNTCIGRSKNSKDLRKNMYRDNQRIYEYNINPMEDRIALDKLSSYRVPLAHSSDDSGQQQQSLFQEFLMDYERPSEQEVSASNVQFAQPIIGSCHDKRQKNVFGSTYQELDDISNFLENSRNSSVPSPDYSSVTNDGPPANHSNHPLNLDSQSPANYESNSAFSNHPTQIYDFTFSQQHTYSGDLPSSTAYPQSTFNTFAPNDAMNEIISQQPESVMDYELTSEQNVPAFNVQSAQPIPCPDSRQQNVFGFTYQGFNCLESSPNASDLLPDYSSVTNDRPPVNHSDYSLNLDSQLPAHYESNSTFLSHSTQIYDYTFSQQRTSSGNLPSSTAYPQSTFNNFAPNDAMNEIVPQQSENLPYKTTGRLRFIPYVPFNQISNTIHDRMVNRAPHP